PVANLALPATVQAVLAARIDRLAEREKEVLQTAAVIGKEVPEAILRQVSAITGDDLAAALRALVGADFLYEAALYPEAEYTFKHPLTQEVAYRAQLGTVAPVYTARSPARYRPSIRTSSMNVLP